MQETYNYDFHSIVPRMSVHTGDFERMLEQSPRFTSAAAFILMRRVSWRRIRSFRLMLLHRLASCVYSQMMPQSFQKWKRLCKKLTCYQPTPRRRFFIVFVDCNRPKTNVTLWLFFRHFLAVELSRMYAKCNTLAELHCENENDALSRG